jgi:carbon monoxide dehydrogenase subunit G
VPAFEKTFFVMTPADAAFDVLSDPARLADYVPTIRLVDSTAVDGALDVDADLQDRDGAPATDYTADRASGRIEWGRPEPDYGGSISISGGTTRTASVTLRLHTPERGAETEAVSRVFDEAVANIRRVLSGRPSTA